MKINWNFLGEGGGVQNKKPSMGEYECFVEPHNVVSIALRVTHFDHDSSTALPEVNNFHSSKWFDPGVSVVCLVPSSS